MKNAVLFLFAVFISLPLFSCKNNHAQTIAGAEVRVSSNQNSALSILNNIENSQNLFIFFIPLFLLLIIGFYVYKNQKQKAELVKIQQTVGFLEEILQTKNIKENKLKELLIEKLDFAKKLTQMNIQPILNNSDFIKQYHKIFGYNIADTLNWDKLYPLFNELYNQIADKLRESHPALSEKELQFCCLIRAEFRREEIAFILSYEYNSIRTIKMRLRVKMGFDHHDDFDQFLFNL